MIELRYGGKARLLTSCGIHGVVRSTGCMLCILFGGTLWTYLLCRAWNLVHGVACNEAVHHGEWTEVCFQLLRVTARIRSDVLLAHDGYRNIRLTGEGYGIGKIWWDQYGVVDVDDRGLFEEKQTGSWKS